MVSKLIELIKTKGFLTLSEAAKELGTTTDVVKSLIEHLRTRHHIIKVDMSKDQECDGAVDCKGCTGCGGTCAVQVDGTPIIYKLNPRMTK